MTSRSASAGSTSNSAQTRSTMALTGVRPSAASHTTVGRGLGVLGVWSRPGRITASPSYTRQATRELRAGYCSGTVDDLPEAGIAAKGKIEARDGLDEVGGDIEHPRHELSIPGEEQDVGQQPLDGLPRHHAVERMPSAMMEKINPGEARGTIVSGSREFAPERRPVAASAPLGNPHDGELVAQQGRVGREPRHGRLDRKSVG